MSAIVVTTTGPEGPAGFIGLSATHFSAAPPRVTVAIGASTAALAVLLSSRVFAINCLSTEGRAVYDSFAARDAPKGAGRFEGHETGVLTTGAPIFAAVTGAMDCRFEEAMERDGTTLILGRVVDVLRHDAAAPLIHFRGKLNAD